jgi:hypothetical protein
MDGNARTQLSIGPLMAGTGLQPATPACDGRNESDGSSYEVLDGRDATTRIQAEHCCQSALLQSRNRQAAWRCTFCRKTATPRLPH